MVDEKYHTLCTLLCGHEVRFCSRDAPRTKSEFIWCIRCEEYSHLAKTSVEYYIHCHSCGKEWLQFAPGNAKSTAVRHSRSGHLVEYWTTKSGRDKAQWFLDGESF